MRRRIVMLAAALVIASPIVVGLTASQAGADVEISFTEHPTNQEFVINGQHMLQPTNPPGPGDQFIFRGDLLQNGATIGYDNVKCTVTFNDNLYCDGAFAINGQGDIFGSALIRGGAGNSFPSVFDAAITGGTFAYRDAHGDAHAASVSANSPDTNWTLSLVTQ